MARPSCLFVFLLSATLATGVLAAVAVLSEFIPELHSNWGAAVLAAAVFAMTFGFFGLYGRHERS